MLLHLFNIKRTDVYSANNSKAVTVNQDSLTCYLHVKKYNGVMKDS